MALFGGGSTAEKPAEPQQEEQMGNQDYFDSYEGNGQEQFTADMMSTPYLSMTQSQNVGKNAELMGTWYCSSSGDNFGPLVRVIPMACKTVWIERASVDPYGTVGRYEPKSIEVEIKNPPPGQRGFPTMTNPKTGNKVNELFVYAVMLSDHPELGVLFFSPSPLSMSACKAWNTKIRAQRLPSGKLAPIFAFEWELELGLKPKPGGKPGSEDLKDYNSMLKMATRGRMVAKDLFTQAVQPQIGIGRNLLAIAGPDDGSAPDEG